MPVQSRVQGAANMTPNRHFLGLRTELGSALILDGVIAAMELGHLCNGKGRNCEHDLGERGRQRLGNCEEVAP